MILNIICLVGILSFANRLQISHCVNTLEVLKKLPEVIEAWETFYINKSKEDIIINIQQCFNIFHGRKWNEQIIESPYLCISQGNGPNELFMGTLVKRKCAGRGEGRPPHSRPSMSGDGPRYRITPFLYQHFLFPFFFKWQLSKMWRTRRRKHWGTIPGDNKRAQKTLGIEYFGFDL